MFESIKPSHRPRIILAFVAIVGVFVLLYLSAIGFHLDTTNPFVAAGVLLFMLIGVSLLLISWMTISVDSQVERGIVLGMLGLHIAFDVYMLSFLIRHLPLPLDQALYAVELYWAVGVIDIVVMFWKANDDNIKGNYKSPEDKLRDEIKELEKRLNTSEQRYVLLEQSSSSAQALLTSADQRASKAEQMLEQLREDHRLETERIRTEHRQELQAIRDAEALEMAARKAEAERKYTAECDLCSFVTHKDSQDSADRSVRQHKVKQHSNGNHAPIPEIVERGG